MNIKGKKDASRKKDRFLYVRAGDWTKKEGCEGFVSEGITSRGGMFHRCFREERKRGLISIRCDKRGRSRPVFEGPYDSSGMFEGVL